MTKRYAPVFSGDNGNVYIGVKDNLNDDLLMTLDTIDKLNEQSETITRQYVDLETQIDIHRAYKMKVKDTLQAFIRGIEDEKGIDKDNEQFQKSMDCALKYLKRLSEELGIDLQ